MMELSGRKGRIPIPDNLSAKKVSDCNGTTMTKVYFTNVSKVVHHPVSITMNDFGYCYNRSTHTIQSVVLRANGIPKMAV